MGSIIRVRREMLHHAVETLLWSEHTEQGESLDSLYHVDHIDQSVIDELSEDVTNFLDLVIDSHDTRLWELVKEDPEQAGHDFILSRNRHGAGFWDRGNGDVGELLHKYAVTFGEISLYVGDDGFLYSN